MTAHVHDPATHGGPARNVARPGRRSDASTRPRWLLPAVLAAIVAGALVVAGVVSLSTVLYAGLFGGMILMHMGGHGHGGHGGGGGGDARRGGPAGETHDASLSRRSSGAQEAETGWSEGPDERAADDVTTSETNRHDQHSSHGCH